MIGDADERRGVRARFSLQVYSKGTGLRRHAARLKALFALWERTAIAVRLPSGPNYFDLSGSKK